jgi:hypothetical protein
MGYVVLPGNNINKPFLHNRKYEQDTNEEMTPREQSKFRSLVQVFG